MRKKLINILLVSVSIILVACGEKAKDDKIEDIAVPLFDKFVNEKSYCKALEITQKRFDYIIDHQTSNEELNKRFLKWQKRAQAVELGCRKEQWPKKEAGLLTEIKIKKDENEKYENLMKFVVSIPANSFGRDAMERDCAYDLAVKNNSTASIMGFSYEVTSSGDPNHRGEGSYQLREGYAKEEEYKIISPGEGKTVRVCEFSIGGGESKLREIKSGLIPVDVSVIELESREKIDLFRYKKKESGYDFSSQIEALKKRIVDENPNNR
jgi:hypothetical protein